jgi:GntR family transcriptional repressor for pyruvate dehydrogenase complex
MAKLRTPPALAPKRQDLQAATRVVEHVRELIAQGRLRPGDRLPPERELARRVGISRPSLRTGLRSLVAMGVVRARQGSGTYITDGPPTLAPDSLGLLAKLHGFKRAEMFEARRVLEVGVAGLAAERASGEQLATMAEALAGIFASMDDPLNWLLQDIRFHRAVASAASNPVLAALVELVSGLFYDRRRLTIARARDLKQSSEAHGRIYAAIRARDPERSRAEMALHLDLAQAAQVSEGEELPSVERPPANPSPRRRRPTKRGR